jgi:GntR family transcriptional regulator
MQDSSVQFEIHPSSGVPIYRQIMDQVQAMIGSGRLASGDLLPSVRQLGADLEVNMMTVSKAYARLEADGILERVRGKGMRVKQRESGGRVKDRQQELKPLVDPMITRAQQLGLTDEQIIAVAKSVLRERRS